MSKVNVQVSGLNAVISGLKKGQANIRANFQQIVTTNANEGVNIAKRNAPVAFGALRNGIGIKKSSGDLVQDVVSLMKYSGFVEFGTGKKVKIPPEWQQMASEMKGKGGGSFDELLNSITAWAYKKGIDEKYIYPIVMSILKKGIEPQPFMYPAWQSVRIRFEKDVKNLAKKYNNQ